MSKVDEVGQVIREPMGATEQLDEGEIDDELEAMEREEREMEAKRKREREDKEAAATGRRVEEVGKQADWQQVEKRRRLEELEGHTRSLQDTTTNQYDADRRLDVSTKRLSQMSIEDGETGKPHNAARMEGVQEAVTESTSS